MADNWITQAEFDLCENTIYQSYIFNFQEDMWNYVYRFRDYETCTQATNLFFQLLETNRTLFLDYVDNPLDSKIDEHISTINTDLTEIRDCLNTISASCGAAFSGGLFLENVERVLDESIFNLQEELWNYVYRYLQITYA